MGTDDGPCVGGLRRIPQAVHQDLPSPLHVVNRVPNRALKLLDEHLRADEVECHGGGERARDGRHHSADLRAANLDKTELDAFS